MGITAIKGSIGGEGALRTWGLGWGRICKDIPYCSYSYQDPQNQNSRIHHEKWRSVIWYQASLKCQCPVIPGRAGLFRSQEAKEYTDLLLCSWRPCFSLGSVAASRNYSLPEWGGPLPSGISYLQPSSGMGSTRGGLILSFPQAQPDLRNGLFWKLKREKNC